MRSIRKPKILQCSIAGFRTIRLAKVEYGTLSVESPQVVFCFDGQTLDVLLDYLVPAVHDSNGLGDESGMSGSSDPNCGGLWLVGIDSCDDLKQRKAEYVQDVDPEAYEMHRQFLFAEVFSFVEHHVGARLARERTALFGYSLGAVAAIQLGFLAADSIGTIFGFSPVGFPRSWEVAVATCKPPVVHLTAGTEEVGVWRLIQRIEKQLVDHGAKASTRLLAGGHHSLTTWGPEFAVTVAAWVKREVP